MNKIYFLGFITFAISFICMYLVIYFYFQFLEWKKQKKIININDYLKERKHDKNGLLYNRHRRRTIIKNFIKHSK